MTSRANIGIGESLRPRPLVAAMIVFVIGLVTDPIHSLAQESSAETDQKYAVAGTVTEESTGLPVAGASITILVQSEQDPEKRMLSGVTDDEGKYRIAVPMGQVNLWFPPLKAGYWLAGDVKMKSLVTSPDQPIAVCDLALKTGPVWELKAIGQGDDPMLQYVSITEAADDLLRSAWMKGEPVSFQTSPEQWNGKLGPDGAATLTEVGQSRKFVFGVGNAMGELIVDEEFDNTQVVSVEPAGSTTVRGGKEIAVVKLTDQSGHHATISGAEVTLGDGRPLLTVRLDQRKPIGVQRIVGRVVDADENPIDGVKVGLAQGRQRSGSASLGEFVRTDTEGRFEFELEQFEKPIDQQYSMSLEKDGYAARDSPWFDVTDSFDEINAGTLMLSEGYAANVQVFDRDGNVAAGAVVEPSGDYALRAQAVRADAEGRATLTNLPRGLVSISVRHGEQYKSTKLIVTGETTDEISKIKLEAMPTTPSDYQRPAPLPIGTTGPELQVAAWSDDRPRSLANLRGKMVVLDFWGVWCGPCVSAIPAMQELADRYEARDVVFLGIHTADGNVEEINKLKKLKEWTSPSAVDRGTTILDGVTCNSYGVSGYPTIVILDPEGKIAYRSDVMPEDVKSREEFMKKMERIAEANGLQMPDEDTPREEAEAFMTKFQVILLSEQLDRLLAVE